MRYNKPTLSFEQQADLLLQRKLIADRNNLIEFLSKVNYYRFSGYLYPFREINSEDFKEGTTFQKIKEIYYFDSELRKFTSALIEEIDVAILRTQLVQRFSLSCSPFCYIGYKNFHNTLKQKDHEFILNTIRRDVKRSKEEFVKKYNNKYTSESDFPFWMISELVSMNTLSKLFKYSPHSVTNPISAIFNIHFSILHTWIHTLTNVRNICAHHARLWNRTLPIKPRIPYLSTNPEFHNPRIINDDSYFTILIILKFLINKINPNNTIVNDFKDLLLKYPSVPIDKMKFPSDWESYQIINS